MDDPVPHVLNVALDRFDRFDDVHALWQVFTRCKHAIDDGQRLENMSWRLWNRRLSTSSAWSSGVSSASSCPSLSCDSGASSDSGESSSTSPSLARSRPKTRSPTVTGGGGVMMPAQPHTTRPGRPTISTSHPTGPVTLRPSLEPRSVSQPAVVSLHAGRFIRELLPNRLTLISLPLPSSRVSAKSSSSSSPGRRLATLVMPSTPSSASSAGAPAVVVLDATPHPTPPATPRVPDSDTRPAMAPAAIASASTATLRVPDAALTTSRPQIPTPAPVAASTTTATTTITTKRFYLSAETPQQSPDSTSSGTGTTASASGDLRPVPSDAAAAAAAAHAHLHTSVHARDPAPPSLSGPRNPSRSHSVDDGPIAASLTSATSSRSRVSAVSSTRRTAVGKGKEPLRHALSRAGRSALAPRKTATRAATLPAPAPAAAAKHAGPISPSPTTPTTTKSGPGASSQRRGGAGASADADQSGAALPLAESPRQVTQSSILSPPAVPAQPRPATSHQAPTPPPTTASEDSVASGSRALPPHPAQSSSQATLNPLPAQQQQQQRQQQLRNVFTGLLRPPKQKVELESSEEEDDDDESSADDEDWTEDDDGTATNVRGQANNGKDRSVYVVDKAAEQLQREADMFAKQPHRSWSSNLDRVPKVGLLTHLFRPDLVRLGLPHHSVSSHDLSSAASASASASARNQGQIPANQMRRPGAMQPFTEVQPAKAQPTLAPVAPQQQYQQYQQHPQAQTRQSPDRRQQQQQQQPPRQRGRPADQELDSDSEVDPEDAVQLSTSEAQQRLADLHRRHKQRTSPLQHELTDAQSGPSNVHHNQYHRYGRSESPPPQATPIPVLFDHTQLPQPLPAVSPRTTRRNIIASEMSESLRLNLLRERQVAKRSLGVHQRNISANQLPQLNDRGEPMSERELAGRQAILRNRSFQGPFTPGGI